MITRIEVDGYRCFPELRIDLGRYHVLAGANGAGKTTLLDIPALLGDLLNKQPLADAFLRRQDGHPPRARTLTELVYKERGTALGFALEASLPDNIVEELASRSLASLAAPPTRLRYDLRLDVNAHRLEVGHEELSLFSPEDREVRPVLRRDGRAPTTFTPETTADATDIPPLRVPASQLALGAVPADPTLFPAALWFDVLLSGGVVFFDPDWDVLRGASPPGDPPRLLPSGRNTPWLALGLQRDSPERYSAWVDHVRTALPQVETIGVTERADDHHAYFEVRYSGGYHVTSTGLSDGTLRILALTLLPYLEPGSVPRLLVTEEPENGIHPRAIETVTTSLSSLHESQVWVSTHSPIVLAHTSLRDVLAARLDSDGAVTVIPGDQHPRLRGWQGSLDIGTLFAAGVLS